MSSGETFRAGVGAVVVDRRGRVLACERADVRGGWQLPQGGLEPGEAPLDAAVREVAEETGIAPELLTLLDEYPEWLAYEHPEHLRRPKHGRGQVQRWFLLRFLGTDADIDLARAGTPEFRAWRWTRLGELAEETVAFRRPTYRKLAAHFAPHLDGPE